MKTKIFTSLIVSAFLLTLLASFASASGPFTLTAVTVPTSAQNDAGSFNVVFNITYTGSQPSITVDFSGSAITQGTATILLSSPATLNQGETKQVTATVNFPSGQTGSIQGNINAVPSAGPSYTEDLPFIVTLTTPTPSEFKFCEFDNGVSGNPGNLKVTIKNINVKGYGEDNEWLPFDEIEVEVRVENNDANDNVDNIQVEWGLYDKNTDDWVIEVDEVDEIDLNDGDEDTITFTFTIDEDMDEDLSDLEDGDNYVLYVRATGEVDNTNNDDSCSSDSEDISMVIERDFVVLSDLQIPDSISCGSEMTLTGDVWNIGSRDQNEVLMKVVNSELKINQDFSVGDIDSFDSQSVELKLNIPENAKEKSYTLAIEVYDDNGDLFQNDFNDDESKYNAIISVGSCEINKVPTATVSADLISESKAGKQLVVKATIRNTGTDSATYLLNAAGHGSWASLSSIDPESLTLTTGKTGEATFTFDVNRDVSGDQTFNIEVVSDNALVTTQPVSVTVEASKSSLSDIFGDSWYIWLIGALNVILVIVIIVIAVRVAKK